MKNLVQVILLLICFQFAKAQTFNANLAAKLQARLDSLLISFPNTKGMSVGVYCPGQGFWKGVSGVSYAAHPITHDMKFGIASNTKLFTAATILKLAENNILSLNDPLSHWLPNYTNVNPNITIRQLLNHTSGLSDPFFTTGLLDSIKAHPTHVYTPQEILSLLGPPVSNPGAGYNYSNLNYILAGMVAKSATGISIAKLMRDNILAPLQLDSTFYDIEEPEIGIVAHRWQDLVDVYNIPRISLNTAGGPAGSLFSTGSEMAQWYHALMSGQVLNANSFAEMTTFVSPGNYGLGIQLLTIFGRTYWGHGGSTLGFTSRSIYDPCMKTVVCGLSNSDQSAVDGSTAMLYKLLVDNLPGCPGSITGLTTVCQGKSAVTYTIPAIFNTTSYVWTLPNGVTGISSTNSITVNYGLSATSGNITVKGTNSYGESAVSTLAITVNPVPATGVVAPTQPTCAVATGTIDVTSPLGASYTYSIGGQYQSSPTFNNLTPGSYTLSVQSTLGCFAPATTNVTINTQPVTVIAPTVTGIVNVCAYIGTGTPVTYTFASTGATGYSYILPLNVNLVSSTSNSISVTFQSGFAAQANKMIKVTALSTCGNSPQTTYYLLAQAPAKPAPIVGNTNVCPIIGTPATYTYTIPSVVGAIYYSWVAQAGTTTINHTNGPGINDTTVTVSFTAGFTSSAITVQAVNSCGSSAARSLSLTRVALSTPGSISGPKNVCEFIAPGGTPATYSIALMTGATSYNWAIPAAAIGINGQGTNTISFIYPAGFAGGTIAVTASNGCGTSLARSLSVTKTNPSTPGAISALQTVTCPDRVYTYTLASTPANSTSVQWTIPSTGTLLSGQGSNSITVSYPGAVVNGNVTAQAFNNCGYSSTRTLAVKLTACIPPVPFAKGEAVENSLADETMQVNVFPNPSVSDFKLQVLTAGKQMISVRIIDMQGHEYKKFEVLPGQIVNFGNELKAGNYMIVVKQGSSLKTVKLLKF